VSVFRNSFSVICFGGRRWKIGLGLVKYPDLELFLLSTSMTTIRREPKGHFCTGALGMAAIYTTTTQPSDDVRQQSVQQRHPIHSSPWFHVGHHSKTMAHNPNPGTSAQPQLPSTSRSVPSTLHPGPTTTHSSARVTPPRPVICEVTSPEVEEVSVERMCAFHRWGRWVGSLSR